MKFYRSTLVGVIIKVIMQNARCNNKDINLLVFRILFLYLFIYLFLLQVGEQPDDFGFVLSLLLVA